MLLPYWLLAGCCITYVLITTFLSPCCCSTGGYDEQHRKPIAFNEKNSCRALDYVINNSNVQYMTTAASECLDHHRFSSQLFAQYEMEAAAIAASGGRARRLSSSTTLSSRLESSLQRAVDRYMTALEDTIAAHNNDNRHKEGLSAEVLNTATRDNLVECERILLKCKIPAIRNDDGSYNNGDDDGNDVGGDVPSLVLGDDEGFHCLDDADHPFGGLPVPSCR